MQIFAIALTIKNNNITNITNEIKKQLTFTFVLCELREQHLKLRILKENNFEGGGIVGSDNLYGILFHVKYKTFFLSKII